MSGLITHVNKLFISITKNAALQTYCSTTAVTSVQFDCFKYFINGYTVLSIHIFYEGSDDLTKFTLERGGGELLMISKLEHRQKSLLWLTEGAPDLAVISCDVC